MFNISSDLYTVFEDYISSNPCVSDINEHLGHVEYTIGVIDQGDGNFDFCYPIGYYQLDENGEYKHYDPSYIVSGTRRMDVETFEKIDDYYTEETDNHDSFEDLIYQLVRDFLKQVAYDGTCTSISDNLSFSCLFTTVYKFMEKNSLHLKWTSDWKNEFLNFGLKMYDYSFCVTSYVITTNESGYGDYNFAMNIDDINDEYGFIDIEKLSFEATKLIYNKIHK